MEKIINDNSVEYIFNIEGKNIKAIFYSKNGSISRKVPFIDFVYGEVAVNSKYSYKGVIIDKKLNVSLSSLTNELRNVFIDFNSNYGQPVKIDYIATSDNEDVLSKASYFNSILDEIYSTKTKISDNNESYIFKN